MHSLGVVLEPAEEGLAGVMVIVAYSAMAVFAAAWLYMFKLIKAEMLVTVALAAVTVLGGAAVTAWFAHGLS